MNLLILTLDTRGDVQPFVALPRGLANAGHEAVLAAPHRFEGFVRDQGVPFAGIDDCWSVAAEGPGAGADILCTTVRWSSASMSRRSWDPGRAGVADTHVRADSRGSLGGHSDTALVALGAESGHLSRGEGPGDDVRPPLDRWREVGPAATPWPA